MTVSLVSLSLCCCSLSNQISAVPAVFHYMWWDNLDISALLQLQHERWKCIHSSTLVFCWFNLCCPSCTVITHPAWPVSLTHCWIDVFQTQKPSPQGLDPCEGLKQGRWTSGLWAICGPRDRLIRPMRQFINTQKATHKCQIILMTATHFKDNIIK